MTSPITTHVLDTALGRPVAGLEIRLERWSGGDWIPSASGTTDLDGRSPPLLPPGTNTQGRWRIRFDTGAYFEARGVVGFYPWVEVVFEITDPLAHHHVPLLLSPFGYSTYRGS